MAFNSEYLNNIAGSKGQANIWIYTPPFSETEDLLAEVTADSYFNSSSDYGLKHHDTIIAVCPDGSGIFRVVYQPIQKYFYLLDFKPIPLI